VTTDEIRLVIPAEEDFRPIAHLVTGGLASRLDVTYDDLDDLQVGIEALLALRDDAGELVLSLSTDDDALHASLGPFALEALEEGDSDGGLDLRRVLETVCDSFEIEEREGNAWVELTKRIASPAGAAGG
jgi:anti-sigma regulatory factor (Ser/Thr protein kinase)